MLEELHNRDVSEDFLEGFPLKRYGYVFEARLNAKDSWEKKVVCSVLKDGSERQVSTTYPDEEKYLKFLDVSSLLKEFGMLHPEVSQVYDEERTVICHYIGEFLPPVLLNDEACSSIDAVFDYLALLRSMSPTAQTFEIPRILRGFLTLSDQFSQVLPFVSETKNILPQLEERGICFQYGSGIEDPDIKNFRVIMRDGQLQALTTDYDRWSDRINYFWAAGYFYASLRWLAKASPEARKECSEYILRTIDVDGQRAEFMFWLGVLSGYCGYGKTMKKAIVENRMNKFQGRLEIIKELDEKVSRLANALIEIEEEEIANRAGLYLSTD